jgi:hypothetical protein
MKGGGPEIFLIEEKIFGQGLQVDFAGGRRKLGLGLRGRVRRSVASEVWAWERNEHVTTTNARVKTPLAVCLLSALDAPMLLKHFIQIVCP